MEQPEIQDSEVVEVPAAEESHSEVETPEIDQSDDGEVEAPDEEEVEYEGEKYKLPKNLKEALLRQSDYTRKTQEVAEQRKAVDAEREQVRQQAETHQKFINEVADLVATDKQLAQYQQVDWQSLMDSDPVSAMKLDRQMRDLQQHRANLAQTVAQKQQQAALEQQQETARRLQEGQATLERDIPGWSADKAKQVSQYMEKLGADRSELGKVSDPAFVKAFYKAQLYDQLVATQAAKPKPEAQEKPVTRITATKATANRDPDKMSADEWLKWRNSQIKKR